VECVAEPKRMQGTAKFKFGARIFSANSRHHPRSRRWVDNVYDSFLVLKCAALVWRMACRGKSHRSDNIMLLPQLPRLEHVRRPTSKLRVPRGLALGA
jgi:hypothetical protein